MNAAQRRRSAASRRGKTINPKPNTNHSPARDPKSERGVWQVAPRHARRASRSKKTWPTTFSGRVAQEKDLCGPKTFFPGVFDILKRATRRRPKIKKNCQSNKLSVLIHNHKNEIYESRSLLLPSFVRRYLACDFRS